jgi:HprK-related kinase B
MTDQPRLSQILAPLLEGVALSQLLKLSFGGIRIDVRANDPELIARLARYYRDFRVESGAAAMVVNAVECSPPKLSLPFTLKEREPGKAQVKEGYADLADGRLVRKVRTDMVFAFGGREHYAFGPCIQNEAQVVNFVNNRYIQLVLHEGGLLFHSAAVGLNGRCLALAGFAGAGKSTLALHIMRLGTDFISNDRAMMRRSGDQLEILGVPKMPRVNPGTVLHNESLRPMIGERERAVFEAMPPAELWNLEHKYDAFIDECFGPNRFKLRGRLTLLVILNWRRDSEPLSIRPVRLRERTDLLPAFMKDVGLFFEADDPEHELDFSAGAYLDLLDHCRVVEVTGGVDFEKAARAILALLEQEGRHP